MEGSNWYSISPIDDSSSRKKRNVPIQPVPTSTTTGPTDGLQIEEDHLVTKIDTDAIVGSFYNDTVVVNGN